MDLPHNFAAPRGPLLLSDGRAKRSEETWANLPRQFGSLPVANFCKRLYADKRFGAAPGFRSWLSRTGAEPAV